MLIVNNIMPLLVQYLPYAFCLYYSVGINVRCVGFGRRKRRKRKVSLASPLTKLLTVRT